MDNIINLVHNWQNLVGSLIGALIAILGAFLVSIYLRYRDKIKEQRRQYANLLLVLHNLQLFITRCEMYLVLQAKRIVSFNKIILIPSSPYVEASQIFDLNPEVYNSVQKIYNVAEVIKYNIEKSEVIKTQKLNKEYVQESIICKRYHNAMAFIRHWLKDIYHNFNIVAIEIKNLSTKYKSLNFPKTIKFYSKEYVDSKAKKFKLEDSKLDAY